MTVHNSRDYNALRRELNKYLQAKEEWSSTEVLSLFDLAVKYLNLQMKDTKPKRFKRANR